MTDQSPLAQEIQSKYLDSFGLVSPTPCIPGQTNTSDNGVLFSSELLVLLQKRGELKRENILNFKSAIRKCFLTPGLLRRSPIDLNQESVDDLYGLAAASVAAGLPGFASNLVHYGRHHFWNFNNVNPGKFTLASWLGRQPQLIYALHCAAYALDWRLFPLEVYTAIIILTSCLFAPKGDSTSRILCWLLIQSVSPSSWLCRQAAKVWKKRLVRDYGASGMKAVFTIYFGPDHPFAKYSADF